MNPTCTVYFPSSTTGSEALEWTYSRNFGTKWHRLEVVDSDSCQWGAWSLEVVL